MYEAIRHWQRLRGLSPGTKGLRMLNPKGLAVSTSPHQRFRECCGRAGRKNVRAWGLDWELWHSGSWAWWGWCIYEFTEVVNPCIRPAQIQANQNSSMGATEAPPLAKELYWVMAAEEGRISFLWRQVCW